ncbi:MAG: hypothetical protein ABL894_03375 [Hyphomicrobium sp.]
MFETEAKARQPRKGRAHMRAICRTFAGLMLAAAVLAAPASQAETMVVPDDEYPRLKKCEERFCTMVLKKEPVGDDLQCRLSKTWAQETIKGGESKTVRWGFGDARCKLNFNLARSEIIAALTMPEYTLAFPSQTVKCEVDREGELKPVTAKLAPKFLFKNGQAEKVWINLTELDGPADIKGTVWTAANLEDTIGIFHGSMIKSINKFLHKKCNDTYGPAALAKAQRKLELEQRRAARAARIAKKAAAQSTSPPVSKAAAPTP